MFAIIYFVINETSNEKEENYDDHFIKQPDDIEQASLYTTTTSTTNFDKTYEKLTLKT